MARLRLMGTSDVAKYLGRTRTTVNRMVLSGALTPVGTIGKRKIQVFDRADIEALAKEEAK